MRCTAAQLRHAIAELPDDTVLVVGEVESAPVCLVPGPHARDERPSPPFVIGGALLTRDERAAKVLDAVAVVTGVPLAIIQGRPDREGQVFTGRSATPETFLARALAAHELRKLGYSYPALAKKLGWMDHTSAMYACAKVRGLLQTDDRVRAIVDEIARRA